MQEILEEFLKEEEAKNHSDATLRKRRMVSKWLDEWTDKPVEEFERSDIRDFLTHLKGQAGDGTVQVYMAQVTKLFEYLVDEDHVDEDDNPCDKVKYSEYLNYKSTDMRRSLREKKSYIALKDDEPQKLLANPSDPAFRNTLMMKLQLETGPRAGELVRLRLKDVNLAEQTVTYQTLKKDDVQFRTLPFSDGVAMLMDEWLNGGMRDKYFTAEESDYVFVSLKSEHISPDQYNVIVKKSAENAGIQEKVYVNRQGNHEYKVRSHVLRHTYAESMVRNGCDISRLADLMGHQNIDTTRKYLDHDEEALRQAQQDFAPDFSVES